MKKSILTPLLGACEYTTYAYDEWRALTNTVYSDGTPTVSVRNDALGRQVGAHDAAGVTTFAYDVYGANTNETIVGVAGTNVLERFADAYGRDVGYALNGERRTALFRDPATGRIAAMRVAGCTNDFSWTYHPGCDLKHTLRYPNGALVSWEYEPRRDLMTLVSNDVYSSFRYTYDVAGRRVSKNDERYFYNARGELILATNVVTGAEFAYRYDDIGNRLWSREFGTNCTYVANGLNQYTGIVRGGVSERAAFDLDGNQTNVVTATGEWAVEYNGENRPVRWTRTLDGATVLMAYDRMGRRVMKDDETFVYDGYLNVGQTVWDPTEPVATRPLVWLDEGEGSYYFHDGNKNVVDIVPDKVREENRTALVYTPFGALLIAKEVSPWQFSSEYSDLILGIDYFNYRHYNPMTGRWDRKDPINEESFKQLVIRGEIEEVNYVYTLNAPIAKNDVLGLKQVGQVKCGACNICLDNDSSSGDGNSYKIHWVCSSNGKTPTTCRGGGSAQFPSYESSHGSSSVPPGVKKCIEGKTRWKSKTVKVSVPISNTKCCKDEEYTSWEPSEFGLSMPNATSTMMTIMTCAGTAIVLIMLSPIGL